MSKIALLILSLSVFAMKAEAFVDKGIYGIDDRFDYFEIKDKLMLKLSDAVAAQIYDTSLEEQEDGKFLYSYPKYGEIGLDKVCKEERFVKQQTGANCTGFLVAPNIMVTAGHCLKGGVSECADFQWAFDYKYTSSSLGKIEFNKSQLVRCSKVLDYVYTEDGLDFAILELEREMTDRRPLDFRKEGRIESQELLSVIGFPAGLPMKFTINSNIRDNSQDDQIILDSDTFFGNSGSPVLNMKSGLVEGILVRGDADYEMRADGSCKEIKKYGQNEGRGEDIIRITELLMLKDL